MKMREKYPYSWRETEKAAVERKRIETLREYLYSLESALNSVTARYEQRLSRGTGTKEDIMCKVMDVKSELKQAEGRLEKIEADLRALFSELNNPTDALFMTVLYVYGSDKTVARSLMNLSVSGFYDRLYRCMGELEKILTGREAA